MTRISTSRLGGATTRRPRRGRLGCVALLAAQPLFLYNVYVNDGPELLDQVGAAAPAETVIDYTVGSGAKRPRLQHTGGELREEWDAASGRLTVTITHRGPVVVRFT